ncbi:hypothetical protein J2X54_001322 [Duganella sp. 3397]|uniref:antitoxin VbhA family protein n=1 Tax=Duganella sp. 3397 TaxID=2817732 RepID=UPI00285AD1EB|nr:antitoxin VbhA family protein [Duganella sp. 3397]MDR7048874.1 hypothetical protein [Duganella sp. 3397]
MAKVATSIVEKKNNEVDAFIEKATSEEISLWLTQNILLKRGEQDSKPCEEERKVRQELVRQSNANIQLEGFELNIQATMLNELYIRGFIDIEQKFALIKKFMAHSEPERTLNLGKSKKFRPRETCESQTFLFDGLCVVHK